ncbi:unnamed protein product [Victoria cruziana]
MECYTGIDNASASVSQLLLKAAFSITPSQWLLSFLSAFAVFLYNFLEIHLIGDLLRGMRGDPVSLIYNPNSDFCSVLIAKCPTLRGRYLPTPWLPSPHLQTGFLQFFGRPPAFQYWRQIFHVPDGGTIALDWLSSNASRNHILNKTLIENDPVPIVVVVPGLTSDSASSYIRHIVHQLSKQGWDVVVSNHRGLGGISITSDCFYNAGWTEDLRAVINYLHQQHPNAPLFAVGTSIGANILVKYLGEEQDGTPIVGAASVCSPWDLVICDRFINRQLAQRFYDRILTIGLQGYAKLHQPILSRLVDWDCIKKSRSVRDFDNHVTCPIGKFETVDTYYRRCSSVSYVENVSVPLLCISALDDPVCTKEAIPWDECRANKNIVLATTTHGGHLAYFEGVGACHIWHVLSFHFVAHCIFFLVRWVGAVAEYLSALHTSNFIHRQNKIERSGLHGYFDSSIDQGPYVNVMDDGMVMALGNEATGDDKERICESDHILEMQTTAEVVLASEGPIDSEAVAGSSMGEHTVAGAVPEIKCPSDSGPLQKTDIQALCAPITNGILQLSRRHKVSTWILLYIAITTTWPLVGSALLIFAKRKVVKTLWASWFAR